MRIIELLNQTLWAKVMPFLLLSVGIYLTFRSGFFQIRKFRFMLRSTLGKIFSKERNHNSVGLSTWESMSTALASTIGTGSIIGIAMAIQEGGAGAIFWMWVSALIGAIIKYAEILLALRYRKRSKNGFFVGGPMYYLKYGLKSKVLSFVFALFCLCTCFGIGNSVQAGAISSILKSRFDINPKLIGLLLVLFAGAVIFGGMKKIASFNAKLVPIMSVLYILCSVTILIIRSNALPDVFKQIFNEAFSLPAALGGVSSYGLILAIKNGFSKGIFSNEAGLGSAPIAHASCETDDLVEQGLWGIFEVYFTTIVICTSSALVVLSCDISSFKSISAADITLYAFESSLPVIGSLCLCFSIVLFSFSTILGWAFYGEICLGFLTGKNQSLRWIFKPLLLLTLYVGAVSDMGQIWTIAEFLNGLMAIPNLIGVLFLSEEVFSITKNYFVQ